MSSDEPQRPGRTVVIRGFKSTEEKERTCTGWMSLCGKVAAFILISTMIIEVALLWSAWRHMESSLHKSRREKGLQQVSRIWELPHAIDMSQLISTHLPVKKKERLIEFTHMLDQINQDLSVNRKMPKPQIQNGALASELLLDHFKSSVSRFSSLMHHHLEKMIREMEMRRLVHGTHSGRPHLEMLQHRFHILDVRFPGHVHLSPCNLPFLIRRLAHELLSPSGKDHLLMKAMRPPTNLARQVSLCLKELGRTHGYRFHPLLLHFELHPMSNELHPMSKEVHPMSNELHPKSDELHPISDDYPSTTFSPSSTEQVTATSPSRRHRSKRAALDPATLKKESAAPASPACHDQTPGDQPELSAKSVAPVDPSVAGTPAKPALVLQPVVASSASNPSESKPASDLRRAEKPASVLRRAELAFAVMQQADVKPASIMLHADVKPASMMRRADSKSKHGSSHDQRAMEENKDEEVVETEEDTQQPRLSLVKRVVTHDEHHPNEQRKGHMHESYGHHGHHRRGDIVPMDQGHHENNVVDRRLVERSLDANAPGRVLNDYQPFMQHVDQRQDSAQQPEFFPSALQQQQLQQQQQPRCAGRQCGPPPCAPSCSKPIVVSPCGCQTVEEGYLVPMILLIVFVLLCLSYILSLIFCLPLMQGNQDDPYYCRPMDVPCDCAYCATNNSCGQGQMMGQGGMGQRGGQGPAPFSAGADEGQKSVAGCDLCEFPPPECKGFNSKLTMVSNKTLWESVILPRIKRKFAKKPAFQPVASESDDETSEESSSDEEPAPVLP